MKKIIRIAVSVVIGLSLSACGASSHKKGTAPAPEMTTIAESITMAESTTDATVETTIVETVEETALLPSIEKENLKVGFIFTGDESENHTAAHYAGVLEMKEKIGLTDEQIIIKWSVPEGAAYGDAAADLAGQGCQIVFGNSLESESYMQKAATEFPNVQFCHASGYRTATGDLPNLHNYYAAVYESHYITGVVAGLKINEMMEAGTVAEDAAKIGYIGNLPCAQVISGFTSFFLGVRSVCPSATMNVIYTGNWARADFERAAAEALISDQCILIGQQVNTTAAAEACEAAGIPTAGTSVSMLAAAPAQALTSASINWGTYMTYAVQSVMEGRIIEADWCYGYDEGANGITELNPAAIAAGTEEKVQEVEDAIRAGTLKVFDTKTWTVKGVTMNHYEKNGTEYISDGYFHESEFGSTPAFDFIIDGITDLTK